MELTAAQIIAIGGRRWNKNGKDRVYLNAEVWMPLIGFEVTRYKTGNVSSAVVDGEDISNSKATQLLNAKVYWENGEIHTTTSDFFTAKIRQGIARAVAAKMPDPV